MPKSGQYSMLTALFKKQLNSFTFFNIQLCNSIWKRKYPLSMIYLKIFLFHVPAKSTKQHRQNLFRNGKIPLSTVYFHASARWDFSWRNFMYSILVRWLIRFLRSLPEIFYYKSAVIKSWWLREEVLRGGRRCWHPRSRRSSSWYGLWSLHLRGRYQGMLQVQPGWWMLHSYGRLP